MRGSFGVYLPVARNTRRERGFWLGEIEDAPRIMRLLPDVGTPLSLVLVDHCARVIAYVHTSWDLLQNKDSVSIDLFLKFRATVS